MYVICRATYNDFNMCVMCKCVLFCDVLYVWLCMRIHIIIICLCHSMVSVCVFPFMCTAGCEVSPKRQLPWYWFIGPDCALVGCRHRRVCAGFLRPQGSHHSTSLLTRWEVSGSCRCERVHVRVWVECVRIVLDGVLRFDNSACCHSSTKISPNKVRKDIVAEGDKRCVSTHAPVCADLCQTVHSIFHFCSAQPSLLSKSAVDAEQYGLN